MNELLKLLNPQQQTLWNSYAQAYQNGKKHKAKEFLKEFIDSVKQENDDAKKQIAVAIYALKESENFSIKFPLFKEILLPVFIEGAKRNEPGFYRMLGEFGLTDRRLDKFVLEELGIEAEYFDSEVFFKKELGISPNDRKAAKLLAEDIRIGLDYDIHEIPDYGLLCELETFKNEIEKFENVLKTYDVSNEDHEIFLKLLKAISQTWESYLAQKEIKTYEDYLHFLNNSDSQIILKWAGKLQTEF